MRTLLPGLFALPFLLATSPIALAMEGMPQFDLEPACQAAARAATALNRTADNCMQEERNARGKVEQTWSEFTGPQRGHCSRLSQLGGMPSYVELLTCLEMAKQAEAIPDDLGKTPARTSPLNAPSKSTTANGG